MSGIFTAKDIIIVGGGAAGLMAARELLQQGNRVTVLEATDRLGGRIHTIHNFSFERPVEKSAEFIHGNLPLTIQLMQEANIGYTHIKGTMTRVINGEWKTQDEFAIGWEELIVKMNEVKQDLAVDEFLEKNFSDDKYKDLRTSVVRFAEGFDVADTSKASVLALREEWMEEEDSQYRVPGGNDQLINYLAKQCKGLGGQILTSSLVGEIRWKENDVTVITTDGKIYKGDQVIITVSLGLLQAEPKIIRFHPAIDDYFMVARKIGFGSVVKVLLQFKEAFWEEKKKNIGFLFANEAIPTWWTQLPSSYPLLTGWAGGPQAWDLEKKDDETILQLALQSLSNIFKKPGRELTQLMTASLIANWRNDPFARGAYSYSMVGSAEALKFFNTPISNTIFFAGEAFYEGAAPGTVEAALVSGRNAAKKIMSNEQ